MIDNPEWKPPPNVSRAERAQRLGDRIGPLLNYMSHGFGDERTPLMEEVSQVVGEFVRDQKWLEPAP